MLIILLLRWLDQPLFKVRLSYHPQPLHQQCQLSCTQKKIMSASAKGKKKQTKKQKIARKKMMGIFFDLRRRHGLGGFVALAWRRACVLC
jgi:hypothetical protein